MLSLAILIDRDPLIIGMMFVHDAALCRESRRNCCSTASVPMLLYRFVPCEFHEGVLYIRRRFMIGEDLFYMTSSDDCEEIVFYVLLWMRRGISVQQFDTIGRMFMVQFVPVCRPKGLPAIPFIGL